jgi:hypothetical protein
MTTVPPHKPQPPREPEAWECCQSGCDPCVFDRYWEAVDRYEQALAAWEVAIEGQGGNATDKPP